MPLCKLSLGWVAVWSSRAIAVGGLVAVQHGAAAALDDFAGWHIEQPLSIDNLFVFGIVFRAVELTVIVVVLAGAVLLSLRRPPPARRA